MLAFLRVSGIGVFATFLIISVSTIASADELLVSSNFESGLSPWGSVNASTACSGYSSSAAVQLESNEHMQTSISGPRSAGNFIVRGYAQKHTSATTLVTITVSGYEEGNNQAKSESQAQMMPGASYAAFESSIHLPTADSYVIRIGATNATACLDDITVRGPNLAPPTATPTATSTPVTPTATSQPTSTATRTPSPTSTAGATQTPLASNATASAATSMTFVNGGFENGTAGWQKIGGELQTVNDPVNSGSRAGALVSSTASTKWAYQVVAVDPSATYSFSGHLSTDAGAASAYLRISWYASDDGSGTQLSTTDSISRTQGGAWARLSTGAVQPPTGARSARLRAMLDPAGATVATLYMDDFSFGVAQAVAASATNGGPANNVSSANDSAPAAPATQSTDPGAAPPQRGGSTGSIPRAESASEAQASPTARIGDDAFGATYIWLLPVALVAAFTGVRMYYSRRRHAEP